MSERKMNLELNKIREHEHYSATYIRNKLDRI